MAITVDTTQYDPARSNSFDEVVAGKCHLQLVEFEEYTSKASNCHLARFEVQHHDDPSMIGRTHSEFISSNAKSMWLLQALAVALGMHTKDDFIAAKQGGKDIVLDFPSECGRQCFAEIRNEPYNGKDKFKIGGRYKSLTDPSASTYPINMGVIGQAGYKPEQIPARTVAAAKPATTTASNGNGNGNGSKPTTPANNLADVPW